MTRTVTGIKEAGHTATTVLCCSDDWISCESCVLLQTTVLCCRGCYSDDWNSRVSHVLLLTDTTGEALQLPLSHICFTHCVFTIILLLEYFEGNFAPADFIIMIVQVMGMVSVLL